MEENKERTSSSELRGRQSVRATFRLSERAIHAINILSFHLGIKQKSLIDHLLEDPRSLKLIARELRSSPVEPSLRVQKTFVLNRKTLSCLEDASRSFQMPRDALVEFSIQSLLPLIARERERHHKRKAVFKDFQGYLKKGEEILKKSRELLGEDDPVHDELQSALNALSKTLQNLEELVGRGEAIEDF